jgi:hypothetical protein
MIKKISLALVDESGAIVPVEKITIEQLGIKMDITIADIFSRICFKNNSIADDEIRLAEKFQLAKTLNKHLKEMKDAGNIS